MTQLTHRSRAGDITVSFIWFNLFYLQTWSFVTLLWGVHLQDYHPSILWWPFSFVLGAYGVQRGHPGKSLRGGVEYRICTSHVDSSFISYWFVLSRPGERCRLSCQHMLPKQLGKSICHNQGPPSADSQRDRMWLCGDEISSQKGFSVCWNKQQQLVQQSQCLWSWWVSCSLFGWFSFCIAWCTTTVHRSYSHPNCIFAEFAWIWLKWHPSGCNVQCVKVQLSQLLHWISLCSQPWNSYWKNGNGNRKGNSFSLLACCYKKQIFGVLMTMFRQFSTSHRD